MRIFFTRVLFLLFVVSLLNSCKRKELSWDTELLAPIMSGTLSMDDLLGDDKIQSNPDNSLQLVFRNDVYSLNPEELITLPDTAISAKFSLNSLVLDDRSIEYQITLGRLAREVGGFTGALILGNHGNLVPVPAIAPASSAPIDIDATDLFEYADLDSGFMDLEVFNGFPIPITNVDFEIRNKIAGDLIFMEHFDSIGPGQRLTRSVDVAGKSIEGTLSAELTNIESPGSGGIPVRIDTNKFIELRFVARDLKLKAAKAVFPEQNLVDDKSEVVFNVPEGELTYARIKSGQLRVTVANTIPDTLHFSYIIPRALDPMGVPVSFSTVLPPSTTGGTAEVEKIFDLAGYELFLTGKDGNTPNAMYNEVTARIDSTGKLIEISLADSIDIYYGLENIVPEYVRGYFGSDTITLGPDVTKLNVFDAVQGGTLDLEQVEVDFSIYNEIGIDARVRLDQLKGINNRTGTDVSLTAPLLGVVQDVNRAFENPAIPGITNFHLDNTNSNIEAFIENLPDEFEFAGEVFINQNGNAWNYQDFGYSDSKLSLSMDLVAPLSLIANDLILVDTIEVDFGATFDNENLSVVGGVLTLLMDNGFPLDAGVQLTFLNQNGVPLFDLFDAPKTISAGMLDAACIVNQITRSKLEGMIDAGEGDKLSKATQAKVTLDFNTTSTSSCTSHLKIYSNYSFGVKMIGDLEFRINN